MQELVALVSGMVVAPISTLTLRAQAQAALGGHFKALEVPGTGSNMSAQTLEGHIYTQQPTPLCSIVWASQVRRY